MTMHRGLFLAAIAACVVLSAAPGSVRAPAAETLKPIPAAEAAKRADETRDFVLDLIAGQIDTFWHAGKWAECVRLLYQRIELDRHDTDACTDLGWVLANMNRDAEAVAVFRAGIADNPKNFDIHHHFGLFYHRRHRYDEAIEQFRIAAKNGAPKGWQHMLPGTLEQAGRKQEALDEWRELLRRFPGDPVAKQHVQKLEGEMEKGRPA